MKKYIFIVWVLVVVFIASPAFTQAAALSQSQIDAIVLLLQSFGADQTAISNVQTSLTGGTPNIETASSATSSTTTTTATSSNTATTTTAPYYNFTRNLKVGFTGDDVIALQKFLTSKGFLTMPDGVARGYFGYSTKSALAAYQKSVGILSTGYFGLLTRTYVNEDQDASSAELTEMPISVEPILSISPINIIIGNKYTFSGSVTNATPNSDVKLYLQRPNGTMKYENYAVGRTNSNGILKVSTTQKIVGGQDGIYKAWVRIGDTITCAGLSCGGSVKSNVVEFNVFSSTTQSSITVLSPNGGESWYMGSTYTITWQQSNLDKVYIYLAQTGGSSIVEQKVVENYTATNGSYSYTVPSSPFPGSNYKIRIMGFKTGESTYIEDWSDTTFSVKSAVSSTATSSNTANILSAIQKLIESFSK